MNDTTSFGKETDSIELITKKQIYSSNDSRFLYSIPFIKYKSWDNVEANVFINHLSPCLATSLLEKYYEFDPILTPMVDYILKWAHQRNILNEFEGYLSSYAMTLLIIFFLQIINPPILESIQEYAMKNLDINIKAIPLFDNSSTGKYIKEVSEIFLDTSYTKINIKNMKQELGYPKNDNTIGELITLFFYYYGFEYYVF